MDLTDPPHPEPAAASSTAGADDGQALTALFAAELPLIYTIAARTLGRPAEVEAVVRETLDRAVEGASSNRPDPGNRSDPSNRPDPKNLRPWLVAIALDRIRNHPEGPIEHTTSLEPAGAGQDGAGQGGAGQGGAGQGGAEKGSAERDGADVQAQRQEFVEAAHWLDRDDRLLLSLWSQEVTGRMSREEIATANDQTIAHVGVRLQQMREHVEAARTIVAALKAAPRCRPLGTALLEWDGVPSPAGRQQIARHTRTCPACTLTVARRVPTDKLLASSTLLPVPPALAAALTERPGPVTLEPVPSSSTSSSSNPSSATPSGDGTARRRIAVLARSPGVRLIAAVVVVTALVTVGLTYAVFRQLPAADEAAASVVPIIRSWPTVTVTVPRTTPVSIPPLPPPVTTKRPTPPVKPTRTSGPTARPTTKAPAVPAPIRTAPTGTVPLGRHSLELVGSSGDYLSSTGDSATLAEGAASGSATERLRATFTVVTGLADSDCVTFRAADGRFLRHIQWRLQLSFDDSSRLFSEDATFCPEAGSISGSASLRAHNFPSLSLHHPDAFFWLQNPDGTPADGPKSSFIVRPALG